MEKMIDIIVKTPDQQEYSFNVEDNMTVREFKEFIAKTVGIPAEEQRIDCGINLLQNYALLRDQQVHGKVVQLTRRPQPTFAELTNVPFLNDLRSGDNFAPPIPVDCFSLKGASRMIKATERLISMIRTVSILRRITLTDDEVIVEPQGRAGTSTGSQYLDEAAAFAKYEPPAEVDFDVFQLTVEKEQRIRTNLLNRFHIMEMDFAVIRDKYDRLQTRNPPVEPKDVEAMQLLINRIALITHNLGRCRVLLGLE